MEPQQVQKFDINDRFIHATFMKTHIAMNDETFAP